MRAPILLSVMLAAVLVMPGTWAQADGPVRVLEDPASDVVAKGPNDTPVPYPSDRLAAVDIRSLDVTEYDDVFVFTLTTGGSPPNPEIPGIDSVRHRILFTHQDVRFMVALDYWNFLGEYTSAYLRADLSGQGTAFETLAALDVQYDKATGVWTTTVPRLLLVDRDGAMPSLGRSLGAFEAASESQSFGYISISGTRVQAFTATDEATGTAYNVRVGVEQTGQARLVSARPYRYSNGEAGTFVFEVEALHLGDEPAAYALQAIDIPNHWNVSLPQSQLSMPPGGRLTVPVVVEVPFQHQHGRIVSFEVNLVSHTDPESVGRILMGFLFPNPPQPGGHHPSVVLHSRDVDPITKSLDALQAQQWGRVWMNTLDEDGLDEAVDVPGVFDGYEGNLERVRHQWIIPLSPGLGMGLDMDLGRNTAASFTLASNAPWPGAVMDGALYVSDEPLWYVEPDMPAVARLGPSEAQDIGAMGQATFDVEVTGTTYGDYVPYRAEQNLYLVLNVSAARPASFLGAEAPVLKPGGALTLPLLEYQDRLQPTFAAASGLAVRVVGAPPGAMPPGATAWFDLHMSSPEAGAHTWQALGERASWVRYPQGATTQVGGSLQATARVGIASPQDAPAGRVEIPIQVTSPSGHAGVVLLRVQIEADAKIDGEWTVLSGDTPTKKSPGPAAVWVLAGLAVWSRVRERHKSFALAPR